MKFLVATDGSGRSERALEHALAVAAAAGADLTVATVVDPDVNEAPGSDRTGDGGAERRLIRESTEDAERRAERVLEAAEGTAAEEGLDVETHLLYGTPVEAIAGFAAAEGFDGVFVGHRGLSAAAERVLGSVAKGLVERSDVPVTVVR
jgi:nucleotide-binding universal stress UspA family protein